MTSGRSDPTSEPQIARNVIRTTSERKGLRPEPLIARTVILTTGARGDNSGASAVMEMDAQRPNNHEALRARSARPSGTQTAPRRVHARTGTGGFQRGSLPAMTGQDPRGHPPTRRMARPDLRRPKGASSAARTRIGPESAPIWRSSCVFARTSPSGRPAPPPPPPVREKRAAAELGSGVRSPPAP